MNKAFKWKWTSKEDSHQLLTIDFTNYKNGDCGAGISKHGESSQCGMSVYRDFDSV